MDKIKLRINTESLQQLYGVFIELSVDKDGVPYNLYWKKRLPTALRDNKVSLIPLNDEKESTICQEHGSPNPR